MQEPRRPHPSPEHPDPGRSEFLDSLRKGALIGVGLLVLIVPLRMVQKARAPQPQQPAQVATAPATAPGAIAPQQQPNVPQSAPSARPGVSPALRLANFGGEEPSADARLVANWVVAT